MFNHYINKTILALPKIKNYRCSDHLDALRGIAALLVLVGHIRSLFFIDYSELSQGKNWFITAMYFITSLGHQAVIIFFILSGFLIAFNVTHMLRNQRWSWTHYLIARFSRLFIVLLPALLLCALLDKFGTSMFGTESIYGGISLGSSVINFHVIDRSDLITFIGNVLFLQEIFTPPFGSDSPLWSLSYEFWYYLLFPLLLSIFYPRNKIIFRITAIIVSGLILYLIGSTICKYFVIWLIGASLLLLPMWNQLHISRMTKSVASILCLLILPIALICIHKTHLDLNDGSYLKDLIIGITCGLCVYGLIQDNTIKKKNIYSSVCQIFAHFSYTLYLVHLPLLFLLRQFFLTNHRWLPDTQHLIYGGIICCFLLTYAFIISRFTESKTEIFRQYCQNLFSRKTAF